MFNLQNLSHTISLPLFSLVLLLCLTVHSQKTVADPLILNQCWFYPTNDGNNITGLASDNEEFLYLSLSDGRIISLSLKNAEKYWETELVGAVMSESLVDRENIFVITTSDFSNDRDNLLKGVKTLHCLSKSTGIIRWQTKLSAGDKVFLYDSGNFIAFINGNGEIYSVDKTDGRISWIRKLNIEISALSFNTKNEIILGTSDQRVTIFSLRHGKPIKSFKISILAKVIIEDTTGNNIIVGDKKGILWSLNKKKKTRNWSFRPGAEISSLTLTTQGLLVTSFDNFVYLISERNGKMIWKNRLPGRIAAEPQLRNNSFIITSVDDSEALVIELSSGKLVNKIILEEGNFFTGESLQTKFLFIYNTQKGVLGFSTQEGCGKT